MKVDCPRAMLSEAPTRAKRRSTTGSFAERAGTNDPVCASRQSSAVCRRKVDLPPMFGPVRMINWCVDAFSVTSFGTKASGAKRSTTGWRASVATISSPECM